LDKRAKIEFGEKVLQKANSYSSVAVWNRLPREASQMDSVREEVKKSGGLVQMGKKLVLSRYLEPKFSVVNPSNMKGEKLLVLFNGGFEVLGSLKKALKMPFVAGNVDGIELEKEGFEFASKFSSREQMLSSLASCISSPLGMLASCLKIYYEKIEGKI
jgi:ribosomal protein L10